MAEEKFTPGPWAVNLNREFVMGGDTVNVEALAPDGVTVVREICSCMLDTDGRPTEAEWLEDVANARLIAAAPVLLETLEEVIVGLQHFTSTYGDCRQRLTNLLAIATGAVHQATKE